MTQKIQYQRSFLKWAGGKYQILPQLIEKFTPAQRFVEAFAGSAVSFLNVEYSNYLICDINQDLIALYQNIQKHKLAFIEDCAKLFTEQNNSPSQFLTLRTEYNQAKHPEDRAKLLLYLNKHAYNGLVRYNKANQYNVPFAHYKKVSFPREQIVNFCEKANNFPTTFVCQDYQTTFVNLTKHDLIYCDPPYSPIEQSSNFTNYSKDAFTFTDQQNLANLASQAKKKNIHCLISNHDTEQTRQLYHEAKISTLEVQRSISCNGASRKKVAELIADYS